MAEYPTLTKEDLSEFSTRPAESYNDAQVKTALAQATLLFKIGTCLTNLPDDETSLELAKTAILAYADYIILSTPYAAAVASPFSSESLGSYSYSKSAAAVAKGDKTGVMWFDLAVSHLGACDSADGVPSFGGIQVFDSDVPLYQVGDSGIFRMLSPKDREYHQSFMNDPSPITGV